MTKPKQKPPAVYPAGFFTEPVRAWTQMRFVPQIRVDRTGKYETAYSAAMRTRAAGGWDRHPCIQPGSVNYVTSGPVQMMERAK